MEFPRVTFSGSRKGTEDRSSERMGRPRSRIVYDCTNPYSAYIRTLSFMKTSSAIAEMGTSTASLGNVTSNSETYVGRVSSKSACHPMSRRPTRRRQQVAYVANRVGIQDGLCGVVPQTANRIIDPVETTNTDFELGSL